MIEILGHSKDASKDFVDQTSQLIFIVTAHYYPTKESSVINWRP